MSETAITGGCQCGAVRFRIEGGLGRASLCHCRMCQKAFGAFYGPLVTAEGGLVWTRGEPKRFRSSNKVSRGFCADCGTPLTFEPDGWPVELAIGALDDPALAPPTVQHVMDQRMPWLGPDGRAAGAAVGRPGRDGRILRLDPFASASGSRHGRMAAKVRLNRLRASKPPAIAARSGR